MASITPTDTNSSPEAISFRDLPSELRQLIYPYALEVQPGLQAPPLLLALASEPYLHAEALEVFQRLNFVLSLQNDIVLEAKKAEEILEIRNLTVIWDCRLRISSLGIVVPIVSAIKTLYGSNNLETITFDLRKAKPFESVFIDPWLFQARLRYLRHRYGIRYWVVLVRYYKYRYVSIKNRFLHRFLPRTLQFLFSLLLSPRTTILFGLYP